MIQKQPNLPLYRIYPESDGKPIAENTKQFRWIVTIAGGLEAIFAERPDVFVAGNLFWYPVENHPEIVTAPDALVAFGRPKGDRGSYLQWIEGDIAPQVVFEILSPGNRHREMLRKFQFYERYGVEEYYLYDPDTNELEGWRRVGERLVEIDPIEGWVSPRLKIRFHLGFEELELYREDGRRLPTYTDVILGRDGLAQQLAQAEDIAAAAREQAAAAREQAIAAREQAAAAQEQIAAAQEQIAAAQEQIAAAQEQAAAAQEHAAAAQEQAVRERARAERLAERLRSLGVDPER